MNLEDWKQIEDLYLTALEREPDERAALLAAAMPEVRYAVEKMLTSSTGRNILDRTLWIDSDDFWPRSTLESGTQLGPYTILGLIGEGGTSSVYRASDSRLNREVAVKILPHTLAGNRNRIRQFEIEAWAAGSLNHPNILTVHDVGSHEGASYLVTELLEGETLRECLNRGKLSRSEALSYARMIATGLAAAHDKSIIHRDLKPENLFLTRDGRLKILDFGLAKFAAPESSTGFQSSTESKSGIAPAILTGTVGYMSPEQVHGLPIDTRSDLFNLGIVLFEMLTGKRPFLGATPLDTLHDILHKEPQLNHAAEIDPELAGFLRSCLEKNPRNRFQSGGELLTQLEALDAPAPTRISRRRVALYAAAGVSAIAGLDWLRRRPSTPILHQLSFGLRGNIATGRFTADGRSVVFTAGLMGGPIETFKMNVDGGEPIPLGPKGSGIVSISAKDELALLLDCRLDWGECRFGRLAVRPLAGGELREIEELPGECEFADWSPKGDLAIIRTVKLRVPRWHVEYPIGNVLARESTGWFSHLRVSPQGDKLAFLRHPSLYDNSGSVEVVDLQGTRKTLVRDRLGLKGLAWTPAGDEVWFSGGDRERTPDLRAVTLDGRERTIYSNPAWFELLDIARNGRVLVMQQKPTSWIVYEPRQAPRFFDDWVTVADLSADGNHLLVYEWGAAQKRKQIITLYNAVSGESKQIGEGMPLALSPNGQWVLATRDYPKPSLVLLRVGSEEVKDLTKTGVATFLSGLWAGDNNVIFVAMAEDGSSQSYIQPINGGSARPITAPEIRVALVSPDGTEVVAYGQLSDEYYRLPISGGALTPLYGPEPGDELLQWGLDNCLYVRGEREDQLFRIDLATGTRKPFKSLSPDPVGLVGIGTPRISPDGGTLVYNHWNADGELHWFDGAL